MSKRNQHQQWRPKVTGTTETAEAVETVETVSSANPDSNPESPSPTTSPVPNASPAAAQGPLQADLRGNSPGQPPSHSPIQPPLTPPSPDSANLTDFVANLSPEQLSRVRALAAAKGISTGPRRGPSGGLLVEIEIPDEACEPIATWASEAGESFESFVRKIAADAITNYCFGDWSAVRPAETKAPVSAAATP